MPRRRVTRPDASVGGCRHREIDKSSSRGEKSGLMLRFGLRSILAAAVVGSLVAQAQAVTSFAPRTFQLQLSSDGPQVLHLADINDDGLDDLLAVDRDRDRLYLLRSTGDGQFAEPVSLRTPGGPLAVATGDFNGDGDLDIVTVNSIAGSVSVFLGDGSGNFSEGARRDSAVGSAVLGVAVGEFDDDDFEDLAVLGPDNVYMMRSSGNGSFARFSPSSFRTRSSNNTSFAIATADFDNDGLLDLALTNRNDAQVAVFRGTGPGTFTPTGLFNVGSEVTGIAVADFDGDSSEDIVTVDPNFGALTVEGQLLRSRGDATFDDAESFTTVEVAYAVVAFDVDNDGKVDLAITSRQESQIALLCQPSDVCNFAGGSQALEAGLWRPYAAVSGLGFGQTQVAIVAGRLNDDELDDLVVLGSDLRTVGVLLNTSSTGTQPIPTPTPTGPTATPTLSPTPFPTLTPTPIPTVPLGDCEIALIGSIPTAVDPVAFAVADFDFDGRRDIAVADRNGNRVIIFYGSSAGTGASGTCGRFSLVRGQIIALGAGALPRDIAVADFDRDSRPDLVVIGTNGLTPLFGPGNQTSEFVRGATLPAGSNPARLAVADFNRDGIPDVVVTDSGGTRIHFFFGVSGRDNPFSGQACPYNISRQSSHVVATDLNRDARPDFVVSSPQTNEVFAYLRNIDRNLTCAALGSSGSANPFTGIAPAISVGGAPRGLRVGNLALEDAIPDIVLAGFPTTDAPHLRVHFGEALGTGVRFRTTATLRDGGTPLLAPVEIALGDINRDARQDLVVLDSRRQGNVIVYLGGLDGRLDAPLIPVDSLSAGAPASRMAQALAVTDVDGDSRDDIIVGHSDGVVTLFLSSDPPPTPTAPPTSTPTPVLSPTPTLSPAPTFTVTPTETARPTPTFTPRDTATPRGVVFVSGDGCGATSNKKTSSAATWPWAGLVAFAALRRRPR